jgi:hypothetical protein
MKTVFFKFQNSSLVVQADEDDMTSLTVLEHLCEDFSHFKTDQAPFLFSRVILMGQKPFILPGKKPLFKTKMSKVYGWGRQRVCVYGPGSAIFSDSQKDFREHHIYSEDFDELYEMSYTTMLSTAGEYLDTQKFHRIHALGIQTADEAGLVVLPTGGGKSALALLCLKNTNINIFSDETPLLGKGACIHAFPTRIGISPQVAEALRLLIKPQRLFLRRLFPAKTLIAIDPKKIAKPAKIDFLICGRLQSGSPRITPSNKLVALFYLLHSMVIGIGVAQMSEHMLRLNSLTRLFNIAFSRLARALEVLWQAENYIFYLSNDSQENFKALDCFLSDRNKLSSPIDNKRHEIAILP